MKIKPEYQLPLLSVALATLLLAFFLIGMKLYHTAKEEDMEEIQYKESDAIIVEPHFGDLL